MNLSKKQLRDITRTALGFAGVLCAAAALIWLGNRNDAVTNAESLKGDDWIQLSFMTTPSIN